MTRYIGRIFWIGVGAAIAYLWDPVSGRSRRARLEDQIAADVRDRADAIRKKARYQAGRAKGVAYETLTSEEPPRDDHELLQKVKSEAVGMVPGSLDHVDVRVDDGIVYLLGESTDTARERELMERVRDVIGVREVRNELVHA
jgi:osmotically-inducible protein OsmY